MNLETGDLSLDQADSLFLKYVRGLAICILVFGHVGGFWFFEPYSSVLYAVVPLFFFISGSVSFYSYMLAPTISFFLIKRSVNLLIPYYVMCCVALIVFIIQQQQFPTFNLDSLFLWLKINPSDAISPFNLGHVWFLRCLFIISLLSPILFKLKDRRSYLLIYIVVVILMLTIQPYYNIVEIFTNVDKRAYITLFYSLFFIGGFLFYTNKKKSSLLLVTLFVISNIGWLAVVLSQNIRPSLFYHTYHPDIYFTFVSISVLSLVLMSKKIILKLCSSSSAIRNVLSFSYTHTFSIFLIHTFGIFLTENIFDFLLPSQKTITYGIIKFLIVFFITCFLSLPFTKISRSGIRIVLKIFQ